MRLADYKILADENIQTRTINFLKNNGFDIVGINEVGLASLDDLLILDYAERAGRIILTQDSDFGKAMYRLGVRQTGIIYLRPGHVSSSQTISILKTITELKDLPTIPFVIVAELVNEVVRLRIRTLH